MALSTFIQIPNDISNDEVLKRFLNKLIEQLDIAFGNRGDNPFSTSSTISNDFIQMNQSIADIVAQINNELQALYDEINKTIDSSNYLLKDGSVAATGILKYEQAHTFQNDNDIISRKGAEDLRPTQGAISDLTQAITDPPTQSEVQNIQDKVNQILAALRAAKIIAT